MEDKLRNLRKAMDSTTHKGEHFTEDHKSVVRKRVHSVRRITGRKFHQIKIIGLTAAVILLIILLFSAEIFYDLDQASDGGPTRLNANQIQVNLIAESISKENISFRGDLEPGRLGIIEIKDRDWNRFLAEAFSYVEINDFALEVQSTFDMVIQLSGEERRKKIWIIDESVYYTNHPNEVIYKMDNEHAHYFIGVMNTIIDSHS